MPRGNFEFWRKKLARTKERDALAGRELVEGGWRVVRLWEHEIGQSAAEAVEKVAAALRVGNAAEPLPIRGEPLSTTILRDRR